MGTFNFKEIEQKTNEFWDQNKIYAKAKEKNKGKKSFYFLDGPPYTSGKVHIGTAWNKSMKDCIMRYKRKKGFDVIDRAGYDMHGLPTELQVEKKFNLKSKDDIPTFGINKFVEECRKFSVEQMLEMNKTFQSLGVWQDFENAYQPIDEKFIEGEWWLIKKAEENGRLYEGKKTMTWCSTCQTALAKHECEYKEVKDNSIFVKFPVQGKEKEFLIIWTTTPWTIPFNLAVMVNPNLDYVKCKIKSSGETWVVAKALADSFIRAVAEEEYDITEEFKGKKLEGVKYSHPFNHLIPHYKEIEAESPKIHSVIMSEEYVDTTAGSGLVHTAPGCGPEDYEVGVRNGLPAYNNLKENGEFPEDMGVFAGKFAKKDDKFFIEQLDKEKALIASTVVEHDYAHCWRCHNPVIFRTTWQWFFKVEDLKPKLIEENNKVKWVPKAAYNAFNSWLENLRDNSIGRQRYWGTPLPIWKCKECDHHIVISTRKELEDLSYQKPKDLHMPYIDEVKIKCQCGGTKERVPDVLDVWVDSGTTSWNSLNYPHETEQFDKYFPPDFIMEGKDQIRGWFNLLAVASMVSMGKPSYKAVYMHGFVQDSKGRKMSKSLGNQILPDEVTQKYGVDTFRHYFIGGAQPAVDLNYNDDDIVTKFRTMQVIWNLHNFIIDLKNTYDLKYTSEVKNLNLEDQYILSVLSSGIKSATEKYDNYLLNEVPWIIENIFLELSRTYVQLVRDKITEGTNEDRERIMNVALYVYKDALNMLSTIAPFVTEQIYQELKTAFGFKEESVHLVDWPSFDEKLIDEELEKNFLYFKRILTGILASRDKSNIGVRWPLNKVVIQSKDENVKVALDKFSNTLKTISNIKNITLGEVDCKLIVKPNFRNLGKEFGQETAQVVEAISKNQNSIAEQLEKEEIKLDKYKLKKDHLVVDRVTPEGYSLAEFPGGLVFLSTETNEELQAEGFAREIQRRFQQIRKELGLNKTDRVKAAVQTDLNLDTHKEDMQKKVGADSLEVSNTISVDYKTKQEIKVKDKTITLFLEQI